MDPAGAVLLRVAAFASLAIAALQFVMYFGGVEVYRICGTPESLIRHYIERPIGTLFLEVLLALLFAGFGAYALSAAGTIAPLPRLRPALTATAVIFIARGLLLLPQLSGWLLPQNPNLDRLYSAAALAIGVCVALPLYRHWSQIGG